jgi:hypothetical protein
VEPAPSSSFEDRIFGGSDAVISGVQQKESDELLLIALFLYLE